MLRIVQNCVGGADKPAPRFDFLTGVRISIKSREIAAGNFQPERVPTQKDIAGSPEVECDLVYLTQIHQGRVFAGISVPHAEDAFRDIHRETIRCNIDKFAGEVGIDHRRLHEQSRFHWSGYIQVLRQWRNGIHKHIIAVFYRTLIARARLHKLLGAAKRATASVALALPYRRVLRRNHFSSGRSTSMEG